MDSSVISLVMLEKISVPDVSVKILDVKIERRFTTETQKENIKKLQG